MFTPLRSKLQWLPLLWHSLSPQRRFQLLSLQVLSLFAAVGEVANLGALLPFLRLLADPQASLLSWGQWAEPFVRLPKPQLLLVLGFGFMVVVATSTAIRVLAIRSQFRLSALVTADLGELVFGQVLMRPYAWHLANNSSKVITYLNQDVGAVFNSVQSLLMLGMNLLIVLLLGLSLIALAPAVMLIVGALLTGFYIMVFRFTSAKLRADGQIQLLSYQASMQVLQEGLGGIRDVLLDRTEKFFVDQFSFNNRRQRLASAAINIKAQVPRYLIEGFSMILIVGVSLSMAMSGQGIGKQLPLLGTLALGAYRLLQPLQQCFGSISNLEANQFAIKRLEPFISNLEKPTAHIPNHSKFMSVLGAPLVSLKDVSFRYSQEGSWVLKDLNLRVESGERLALVGTTGSGKSTCSDILLGLLLPTHGSILVEGQDLHHQPGMVKSWQDRVAHVPQQIYLSDASFAANIAFGVPADRIDLERVKLAARQARIAELIESRAGGYNNLVGERGVRLSGGQRQRIGIARALYKKADLLVLDEATSALDNRTESEVMEAVESLDREITIIMIAHRLSTVERFDRIVVLEKGEITGMGEYKELLNSNPEFKSMATSNFQANS